MKTNTAVDNLDLAGYLATKIIWEMFPDGELGSGHRNRDVVRTLIDDGTRIGQLAIFIEKFVQSVCTDAIYNRNGF